VSTLWQNTPTQKMFDNFGPFKNVEQFSRQNCVLQASLQLTLLAFAI
jgi:hypothetical protein